MNVLAGACLTLLALAAIGAFESSRSQAAAQQTPSDPWEGSTFTSPSSYTTSTDAVFSGVFRHTPPAPIRSVELHVEFSSSDSPSTGCRPAPDDQTSTYSTDTTPSTTEPPTSTTSTTIDPSTSAPSTTPTTEAPPQTSTEVQFSFTVPFRCNGVYDATATANVEDPSGDVPPPLHKSISLVGVKIAIPPERPASITATDNGNHTVTVSWTPPTDYSGPGHPPPDFTGYRVSRKEGAGSLAVVGETNATTLSLVDSSIPASGGAFVYQVESVRKFATSTPLATNGALTIAGPNTGGGGSVGGGAAVGGGRTGGGPTTTDPGAGGTGTAFYDSADDDEPGDALSAVPGGGAIQRFAQRTGAGLLKPFAVALDLGVWAALLLFLTRRAAKAEKAALLAVELEHAS